MVTIEIPLEARPDADTAGLPGYGGAVARSAGVNPLFRSRRALTLDLKGSTDLDVALRLVDGADVFVEGFRPGVCDRLGLGYATLTQRNPELVYCSNHRLRTAWAG